MNQKWMRITGLFLAAAVLTGLLAVVQILMDDRSPDPTLETFPLENELYNGYGLEGDAALSQTLVFDQDGVVCYEDRLFRHFTSLDHQSGNVAAVSQWLLEENGVENLYILPIPGRVLTEEGYREDNLTAYQDFLTELQESVHEKAQVLDVLPELDAHSGEYLYFRTEDSWTHRGAYYGTAVLCQAMGFDALPLEDYWEYMGPPFTGSLALDYTAPEFFNAIAVDQLFCYRHPDGKNLASIKLVGRDWHSQPAVIPSNRGLGAFLNDSAKMEAALLQGAALEQETSGETLLVLCDGPGKLAATYLADYYQSVYVVNVLANDSFLQDLPGLLRNYNIRDVVWIQNADKIGNISYSLAMLDLMQE